LEFSIAKEVCVSGIDWEAVGKEVTGYLQDLIRFDTTNPPGNETPCAHYLADVLKREGFEPAVTESEPGRGNVTARLSGGSEPPLMLLGHIDVVAAEPEKWTHPPFCGEVIDGYIWGRGALDMKNMVAVELMVFLLLKRQGVALNREVIYAATADEEAGKGNHGVGWLLDNDPQQVTAPFVLTEGGGADFRVGGARFYTCQTGQKGIFRFRMVARGRPGHGSQPHQDNAVVKLSRAVAALGEAELPLHPSQTLQTYLERVAVTQEAKTADLLRAVLDPARSQAALDTLPLDRKLVASLWSLLRNTASPTMLQSGSKINVIPGEASAWVDGRLAPGQTDESFLAEIRPLIGDEIEVIVDQYSPPLEASANSSLYRAVVDVMAEYDPEATVVPALSTGGTDAKHICPRRPETQVYGFMPYRQAPGEEETNLIHGHDERTSVENLVFATRVLYDVVCRFCGSE
jgi:acetylornithine deacetylase/succinyl-diaminopimelate desuccinylase-like protein